MIFLVWFLHQVKIHVFIFIKLLRLKTLDASIFSVMKARQWGCVISEFDLWLSARLYLLPYFLNLIEIFRICGYNIKVNLVISKLHGQVNQFTIKDLSKVSENIWLSLYIQSDLKAMVRKLILQWITKVWLGLEDPRQATIHLASTLIVKRDWGYPKRC